MPHVELSSGTRMFYTETGEGRPVLSLHGWCCDGADWAWFVADLPGYRHIVPDHRGHGRSSLGDGRFSPRILAEDAAELAERLGTAPCIVVGHSMGGGVGATLTMLRPDLVSALVLVDPGIGFEDAGDVDGFLDEVSADPIGAASRAFANFYGPRTPRWLPGWHRRRLEGTLPEGISGSVDGYFRDLERFPSRAVLEDRFGERPCPVFLFWGGSDAASGWGHVFTRRPEDVVEVWQDNAHFLHQEDPDRFASRVGEWLAGLGLGPEGAARSKGHR